MLSLTSDETYSYYNVRVLIFRAALINPALHFSNETFGYQMARLAATTALESAFQQIGIYVKLAEEQAGHSWWHELFRVSLCPVMQHSSC